MGLTRRRCLALLASLPGLLWLGGCPGNDRPLRIAAQLWLGYAPLFLARDRGELPTSQIELRESSSPGESIALLRSAAVDGAALTLEEVLILRREGLDLAVVLVFDQSVGADLLLARPDMSRLADLAGRRVGVEPGATAQLLLHGALAAAGLEPGAIRQVPLPGSEHEAAWRAGTVDALVTYDPIGSRLLAAGNARRLFDSRCIPETILDVLAVRREVLRDQGAALKTLLRAHFRARHHLISNAFDATHRLSRSLRLDPESLMNAFRGLELSDLLENHRYLGADHGELNAVAERLAALLVDINLLRPPVDLHGLTSAAYLPRELTP